MPTTRHVGCKARTMRHRRQLPLHNGPAGVFRRRNAAPCRGGVKVDDDGGPARAGSAVAVAGLQRGGPGRARGGSRAARCECPAAGRAPPPGLGQPVDAESAIAFSDAWLTWRAVAAVAIVIFVFGLLSGIVLLRRSVQSRVLPASGLLPRRSRDARGHGDHDVGGGRRTES